MARPTDRLTIQGETGIREGDLAEVLQQIQVIRRKANDEGFTDFKLDLQPCGDYPEEGYYLALTYTRKETEIEFRQRIAEWDRRHRIAIKAIATKKARKEKANDRS